MGIHQFQLEFANDRHLRSRFFFFVKVGLQLKKGRAPKAFEPCQGGADFFFCELTPLATSPRRPGTVQSATANWVQVGSYYRWELPIKAGSLVRWEWGEWGVGGFWGEWGKGGGGGGGGGSLAWKKILWPHGTYLLRVPVERQNCLPGPLSQIECLIKQGDNKKCRRLVKQMLGEQRALKLFVVFVLFVFFFISYVSGRRKVLCVSSWAPYWSPHIGSISLSWL